jgi:c-di-GMP-binding flagellar brake protein YcgR
VFTEQRNSVRKVLKTRAVLALEGEAPLACRTVDVNAGGVSLTVPNPLGAGRAAQVGFDLLVDGNMVKINARVKVQYCILSQGEFKVGLEFVNLDLSAMTSLSRFLR